MRNENQRVKIRVIYDTGSTCYNMDFVSSLHTYDHICESITNNVADKWVQFVGTLNDADANTVN